LTVVNTGADQWEANAESDAFWAILTDPNRTGRRWTEGEFFATGEVEWRIVRKMLDEVDALPNFEGRYLDFGCGVGRMSRQLRADFTDGLGLDISERMVALARDLNPGLRFEVTRGRGLPIVETGSFEFVYSHLVLQHIAPKDQKVLIREFLRILAPAGIAAFQVVTERDDPRPAWRRTVSRALRPFRRAKGGEPPPSEGDIQMSMNILSDRDVRAIVAREGGGVVDAPFTNSADPGHNGVVRFFTDRAEAIRRLRNDPTASHLLSRFYVVRARATERRAAQGGGAR
jgi:SAM-dependent methyltransferase